MKIRSFHAWLSSLCLAVLLLLPSAAFAEVQTYEVDGYYTMGDGETPSGAKARALENAEGVAAQQAGTFVSKIVSTKNHQLVESKITMVASAVLQVRSVVYTPEPLGDVIKYRCHIVVDVDGEKVLSMLSNKEKLEEALSREQDKDAYIAELNRELQVLKRQYQTATTTEQQAETQRKIATNEHAFAAVQLVNEGRKIFFPPRAGESIKYFKQATEIDPQYDYAFEWLGFAYFYNHELENAFAAYKRSFEITPDNKRPFKESTHNGIRWKLEKLCWAQMSKAATFEEKVAVWKRAIELSPLEGKGYAIIAALYSDNGMKNAAYEWDQKAIDFCRNRLISNVNVEDASRYYNLMKGIYLGRGDYEQVAETLTGYIGWVKQWAKSKFMGAGVHYVERAECYEKLGWMEAAQQDYESAIKCFTRSIAIEGHPGATYHYRGNVYEKLGRFHEAKLDYQKAFEICSTNPTEYRVSDELKAAVRRSENW